MEIHFDPQIQLWEGPQGSSLRVLRAPRLSGLEMRFLGGEVGQPVPPPTSLSKAGLEHTLQQERIESPTPPPLIYLVTPREGEQLPDLARSDLVCALGAQAFTRHRRECPRRESLHELPQWHKGWTERLRVCSTSGRACMRGTDHLPAAFGARSPF